MHRPLSQTKYVDAHVWLPELKYRHHCEAQQSGKSKLGVLVLYIHKYLQRNEEVIIWLPLATVANSAHRLQRFHLGQI